MSSLQQKTKIFHLHLFIIITSPALLLNTQGTIFAYQTNEIFTTQNYVSLLKVLSEITEKGSKACVYTKIITVLVCKHKRETETEKTDRERK